MNKTPDWTEEDIRSCLESDRLVREGKDKRYKIR